MRWLILSAIALVLAVSFFSLVRMIDMPLSSYRGALPPPTAEERASAARLSKHVTFLAKTIGARNVSNPGSLEKTKAYFHEVGFASAEQSYSVEGEAFQNLEMILPGSDSHNADTVVVGAHYDTFGAAGPGADDNASGVAAILELANQLPKSPRRKTIRLVLFVNEEPPYFQTHSMGSLVYARRLQAAHVPVSAMISLEMLGYYSDAPGSQKYPPLLGLFYPDKANFICFVADSDSRPLVRQALAKFRETAKFPSEGIAAPPDIEGVGWSDHWSFWQAHYPAIMITDTSLFRYSAYHTPQDTPDKLDFQKMARVVQGVEAVIADLAR